MDVVLRAANAMDQEFLRRLFHEVRSPEFAPLGLPAPMLQQLLDMQFHAQVSGYAAQFPEGKDSIVWRGEQRAGRLLVTRDEKHIHLVDIALSPHCRGMGIGTTLLHHLCSEARTSQRILSLSVKAGNPAERLYTRMGFCPVGGDGHNIAMQWHPGAGTGSEDTFLRP